MAITTLPQIDYTARDFPTIRQSLIDHVKNFYPNDWQDFTEANLGMCLLDLNAYVGDQLGFYLDSQANECYMATVRQRRNAISLAALVGYVPRTTAAASTPLRMQMGVAQTFATVLSAYTTFIDAYGSTWELLEAYEIPIGRLNTTGIVVTSESLGTGDGSTSDFTFTFNFDNVQSGTATITYTIGATPYTSSVAADGSVSLALGGVGILDYDTGILRLTFNPTQVPDNATAITTDYTYNQDINAYQGQTRLAQFISDGSIDQEMTILETPVLYSALVADNEVSPNPNRFEVWLGDPDAPFGNGTGTQWTRVDTLVTASAADTVYSLSLDENDRVVIQFGDNITGAIPTSGGTVNVIYRTGGGTIGNISIGDIDTTITARAGLLAVSVSADNIERGSGGAERESLNEIKVNAPAFARTNDTATTQSDFDDMSSSFSRAGFGAIARAKARLEPAYSQATKVLETGYLLANVPNPTVGTYHTLLPSSPVSRDASGALEFTLYYDIASANISVTPDETGMPSGTFTLTGDASIDSANTMIRFDEQEYTNEALATFFGDDVTVAFGPQSLTGFPIYPTSVAVHYTIGATDYIGYDDGAGAIVGTEITAGTINYLTGAVSITFNTAPLGSTAITFDYLSSAYLAFSTNPDAGSQITCDVTTGPVTGALPTNNIQVYTWSLDADGNLTEPTSSLRDQLKAYLDIRRVMCTSVEVLAGKNIGVNLYLNVTHDSAVDQITTNTSIIAAINEYFQDVTQVEPGTEIPLAALYDVIYPIYGVTDVVIQDVGLRVPVGIGDALQTVFNSNTQNPGEFISSGKLPVVTTAGLADVYRGSSLIGTSGVLAGGQLPLTGSEVVTGSYLNPTTGTFSLKLSTAPSRSEVVWLDFLLDETTVDGMTIWNVSLEPWEIGVVGDIYINDVKVN
jgi:hypothetical protein